VLRIYPYEVVPDVDTTGGGVTAERSLRGSSNVAAERIRDAPPESDI